MEKCSFLSTYDEEVSCFNECPFYCNEETDSTCPFKSITGKSRHNIKRLYQYYFSEDHILNFDEEVEVESEIEVKPSIEIELGIKVESNSCKV